ncbi:HD domain-containing protein (plasmid) [Pontibacillus sp. ALD_SL1]|uniref:HD-GYP domain-containing protein n=1 Tax=Pontibacillus sp. ALD_SL1 TaxID=2777185 RepID=UPI001A95D376|nr:HD domain-containing phosphohydrolase [Pontibacillus sp. ALD_SL1]QST02330.1 HD domain-containing protein [Pontibacillus sp. ALD_SL1]
MGYTYSLAHLDLLKLKSKSDLVNAMKNHDLDSYTYSVHTGQLNMAIGKELGFKHEYTYLLFQCGIFHDTGKLGMNTEFLNYPGAYTLSMYKEMKKHTSGGGMLLEKIGAEEEIINTAKHHHCNYDGSGYPGGFYEKEIPFEARITRISDSVDAYMTKRCYKEGGPANGVLDDLNQYIHSSYDPAILQAFSSVHAAIMNASHKDGNDRPSQHLYMHYLSAHYGEAEKERFEIELLQSKAN